MYMFLKGSPKIVQILRGYAIMAAAGTFAPPSPQYTGATILLVHDWVILSHVCMYSSGGGGGRGVRGAQASPYTYIRGGVCICIYIYIDLQSCRILFRCVLLRSLGVVRSLDPWVLFKLYEASLFQCEAIWAPAFPLRYYLSQHGGC